MSSESACRPVWDFEADQEDMGIRIRRYRPESGVGERAEEDPRDTLLRKLLGALNRMRMMPSPHCDKAEREYRGYCREYRARYGHLTIPTSLPLRLIRRPF